MHARAVWFVAPRRVEIRPVTLDPRPDEILVRTLVSGVSAGTELLAYRGEIDPATPLDDTLGALGGTFEFPFRYGYACVGTVEAGAGAIEAGTTVFAFHPHQDLFAVGRPDVVVVHGIEPRLATMLPLVETALQISLDADVRTGELAVVTGLGTVGTLTGLLLQRSGVEVLGVETREDRRKLAFDVGLTAVEPDAAADAVHDRSNGRGADVAIEASGAGTALASALGWLRHEGTALVASWYGSRPVALPLGGAFHRRRLAIRSTQVSTIPAGLSAAWDRERRLRAARDLLPALPLGALATHTYAFTEAAAAYRDLDRGAPGTTHVALEYR